MGNSAVLKGLLSSAKKYSPQILTAMGIGGAGATIILAVKATPKALELIKESDEVLTPVEIVKTAWKCYIPTVVTGLVSTACLIGANSVSGRRNALLATAYAMSESTLKEYREKVIETLGEKKERLVRDAIAKERVERNPVSNKEVVFTSKGEALCYDPISGRYFKSDIETMRKAANNLNRLMLDVMTVSVNDLYYDIGLKPTKQGDQLGWNVNDGFIDFVFSSQLADDGTPCLVLDYATPPRYDFDRR